jgi:hypothetical protein
MANISKILRARYLPARWNDLADDYFQTKEFLIHTEKYNPCQQRYYIFTQGNHFKAGAVVYTLCLNLFTYLSLPSPIKMHVVGIPCSVSSCGILGEFDFFSDFISQLKLREKGTLLLLNLNKTPNVRDMAITTTLPTVILSNRFKSWDNYVNSLRANYRRRLQHLSRAFYGVEEHRSHCSEFSSEMYGQYREVLKRSKGKLETLMHSFFQNLPLNFSLTAYYNQQDLLGWYISTIFQEKYYFFLGGIDYRLNGKYNTYFNILFKLLREGIERKASIIDFGQTAEIPKTRLGGKIVEKKMIGHHSNWILCKMLQFSKGILGYRAKCPETHVFR